MHASIFAGYNMGQMRVDKVSVAIALNNIAVSSIE